MNDLKTAVVTGASAGIGEEIARSFLADGYRVIALDRHPSHIDHHNLVGVQVDLTDRKAVEKIAVEIGRYAPTTIVHNAGVVRSSPLEDVRLADLDELVELFLASAIGLTQACLPAMKAAHFGRIIVISSRAAVGLATRTVYSATKAAEIGMAKTWALELGPLGITVNVIAPGPIATRMFTDVVPLDGEKGKALIGSLPMRRVGTPADIARAVMFFADERNSFVTGQTLFVCGGASVGYLQM